MEEKNVTVSIEDAVFIVNMIDICAQRGAFKGPELSQVGTVRGVLVEAISNVDPSIVKDNEEEVDGTE